MLGEELAALEELAAKTAAERSARHEAVDAAADRCGRDERAIHLGLKALGDSDDEAVTDRPTVSSFSAPRRASR